MTFAQRPLHAAPIVATLVLALAGCSSLEPDKIDYRSSGRGVPLEVPPDLTQLPGQSRYSVPATVTASGYQAGQAATAGATKTTVPNTIADVHYMRNGDERWLQVDRPPEKVWPLVRDFWLDNGFLIAVDNPTTGILETDWAENRAKIPQDIIRSTIGKVLDGLYSTPNRDKFRTRLEPGKEPGTVEIYVSHRGMMEIYPTEAKDTTIWQPRPADPELEAEMLRRLMVRLGADEARAKAAITTAPVAERAKITSASNGQVGLTMDEPFDRAWRRVGLALDRIGFTVEDRNRTEGLYFVRYVDPDADTKAKSGGGFLSRLAFWRSSDKPAASGSEYRLRVQGLGDQARVSVLTREGGADNSDTAKRILGLLQQELR